MTHMANSLGGITKQRIGEIMAEGIEDEMQQLIAQGLTREQAARIMADALNGIEWQWGTAQSPLGETWRS